MMRALTLSILFFLFSESCFAQDISAVYDVKSASATNEYSIKTTILGLDGVDIASIKFLINNDHTYKPSSNNQLFSDRNENYIKFYIMAIPTSGIINIELGVILGSSGEYAFPVELQYSRNEEKKVLNLPEIVIKGNEILAVAETPKPTPPIVKEEPVVEVAKPTFPVVKEEPIVEVAKSTHPIVKEEPAVEIPKPPVVKEVTSTTITNKASTKYTVQLLSLLEFSQTRLTSYCKQHNIPLDKVKKNKKGEWMKITYGEANSKEEANQIIEKLKKEHQVNNAFIVPLN